MKLFFLLFILATQPVLADWQKHHEEDGVIIYVRDVEGSKYREFKASVNINATPAHAVALLQDNDACPRWVDPCESSTLLEEVSKTERYFHQVTDLPFPAKSRDAVFHGSVTYNADGSIAINLRSAFDRIPEKKFVRIIETFGQYLIEPVDGGGIRLTWQHFVDPAGALPAWIVNSMMTNLPLNSLRNFRDLVKETPYNQATFVYDSNGIPIDIRLDSGR